ncbi:unnamed protein product, partial [Ilex paraguariensis]
VATHICTLEGEIHQLRAKARRRDAELLRWGLALEPQLEAALEQIPICASSSYVYLGSLTFCQLCLAVPSYYCHVLNLTPNEIIRVCQFTRAETAPFFILVTPQNLFRFEIRPNLTVILVVAPNPHPNVIDVDSFPTESDEDAVTSSRRKRKRR